MMKNIFCLISGLFLLVTAKTQPFEKAITTAQTAYSAGKLDEAHFALQQALVEVDITIGKEVLKLLPPKMDTLTANTGQDNVFANQGYVGATIYRTYGKSAKKADLSIISNSPLVATMNTLLNTPMMGAMMSDPNNKTVKVQGYKGHLSKQSGSAEGLSSYQLQIPLGSALITFMADDCNEDQVLAMANTLPLQQIARLIQ